MSAPSETDEFSTLCAPEPETGAAPARAPAHWKVLVVDDEPDIHAVLRLAMQDMMVEGMPLRLIDAHSAEEARAILAREPDIARILLDVVMETENAGLELVRHVRQEVCHRMVRMVLVTRRPGDAPQREGGAGDGRVGAHGAPGPGRRSPRPATRRRPPRAGCRRARSGSRWGGPRRGLAFGAPGAVGRGRRGDGAPGTRTKPGPRRVQRCG